MDPTATLKNILTYLEDVSHLDDQGTINLCKQAAAEACEELAAWLRKGGYAPDAYKVSQELVSLVDSCGAVGHPPSRWIPLNLYLYIEGTGPAPKLPDEEDIDLLRSRIKLEIIDQKLPHVNGLLMRLTGNRE
jgi:hypothetical protein